MKDYVGFSVSVEDKAFFEQFKYGDRSKALHDMIAYYQRDMNVSEWIESILHDYNAGKLDKFEVADLYFTMKKQIENIEQSDILYDILK